MSVLYNTQGDLANELLLFFESRCKIKLTKPQRKVLPFIILGMIESESIVTKDIAKKLKGNFSSVHLDSVQKRISRFFNNSNFDIFSFYDQFLKYIISNYKIKHPDKKIHISFDHMFCRDDFTILFFSLRIGKQGIPLWFRCFKGKSDPNAFSFHLIKQGITYVSNLFANTDSNLIFLADRWFPNHLTMKLINDLGHTYVFRLTNISLALFDVPSEKHKVWKELGDINHWLNTSRTFTNIEWTRKRFKTNIIFVRTLHSDNDDPWILATNGVTSSATKDYAHRFGSIESIFKNQKSNGFYLESTNTKNVNAFSTMFGLLNVALTWLTILGSDYTKNKNHYLLHQNIKIQTTKRIKGVLKRVMSLFETGLTLFNIYFNSIRQFKLKTNFVLYDV